MHVRGYGGEQSAEFGEGGGRNVCGADCGNVISRYVAVGRPSSSWYHLPTYDLSFVPRRGGVGIVVIVANAPRENVGRGEPLEFPVPDWVFFRFPCVSILVVILSFHSLALLYVSGRLGRTEVNRGQNSRPEGLRTDIPPQSIGYDWDMDLRELILAENVEMSRNAMSNPSQYIIAKLRDSDSSPTIGYEWSVPLFMSQVILYAHKLSMRIAESSVLEFGLVRKILSALVVVVRLPGAPLTWAVTSFLLFLPVCVISSPAAWILSVSGFVTLSSDEFSSTDLRVSYVQLPSPVSKGTKKRNEPYIFHGLFRVLR